MSAALLLAAPVIAPLAAQGPGETPTAPERPAAVDARAISEALARLPLRPLVTLGSPVEERLRTLQLLGEVDAAGFLLRSPSSLTPPLPGEAGELRWRGITPELRVVRNSNLPYSLNEGAIWAGRGFNTRLMTGVRAEYGRYSLILAPQIVTSANRDFQVFLTTHPERGSLTPPWYLGPHSIDLPARPGDLSFTRLDAGQSTLAARFGGVETGLSTENQWWGPGMRNAILLSSNAPGFPHLFLRSAEPLYTRAGILEGRWLLGGLTESLYFDNQPGNGLRSLSAAALTFRPTFDPDLSVGVARTVYGPAEGVGDLPARALDFLRYWGAPGEAAPGDRGGGAREQLLSLFARWLFPENGLEAYAEWARVTLPSSLRELLTTPNHGQGYTVGLQWARPVLDAGVVRLHSEVTYLEQSPAYRVRPTPLFYVSSAVPQGYTHRGQVLGAAIGPGASSQWIGADFLAPAWQLGLSAGRIRWDNDAYYRQPTGRSEVAHDVSMLAGVRAGARVGGLWLSAELTHAQRYNYLYQNHLIGFTGEGAVDPTNNTLSFTITPWSDPRDAHRR